MGPADQTQFLGLGSRCLYLLSHLDGPSFHTLNHLLCVMYSARLVKKLDRPPPQQPHNPAPPNSLSSPKFMIINRG